jgi:hypothetical protein
MDRRVQRVAERQPRPITSADIVNSPAWWELRGAIVTALRPYPEARAAVAEALRPFGADDPDRERGRRR